MKKINLWIEKNKDKLWFSILLNIIILSFLLLIFGPVYEENDDTAILGIASGLKGVRDSHLVFINYFWGWILRMLYGVDQSIPWYAVMQYALLFIAFVGITYILIKLLKQSSYLWLILIFLLVFSYEGYVQVNFTKTAGIVAAAGFTLLFWTLFQEKISLGIYITGFLLALIGSMYRYNQFFCEAVLFTGLGVYFLLFLRYECDKGCIRRLLTCVGTFLFLLLVVFGVRKVDRMMYASEEWSYYLEYNSARAELLDYGFPDYYENEEACKELGIDETAYQLLKYWTHSDSEKITADTLKQLGELKEEKSINVELIKKFVKKVSKGLLQMNVFWCFVFIAVWWLFRGKHGIRQFCTLFYEAFVGIVVYFYLFYRGRCLINRVDVGIWIAASIVLFWMFNSEKEMIRHKWGALIFTLMALVSMYAWKDNWRINQTNLTERARLHQTALEEIHADTSHLYLTRYKTVSYAKAYSVWDSIPFGLGSNTYPLGGWTSQTPVYLSVLDEYDIDNPFRDMINNEKVYLVDSDIESTMNYIHTWYDAEAEAVYVKTLGKYPVYQIQSIR